jgi:hypothetical protein
LWIWILLRHGSKLFDILFEKRSNNLKDYKETLATMTNTLARRDINKKCEDRNKKRKKEKRFKVKK